MFATLIESAQVTKPNHFFHVWSCTRCDKNWRNKKLSEIEFNKVIYQKNVEVKKSGPVTAAFEKLICKDCCESMW